MDPSDQSCAYTPPNLESLQVYGNKQVSDNNTQSLNLHYGTHDHPYVSIVSDTSEAQAKMDAENGGHTLEKSVPHTVNIMEKSPNTENTLIERVACSGDRSLESLHCVNPLTEGVYLGNRHVVRVHDMNTSEEAVLHGMVGLGPVSHTDRQLYSEPNRAEIHCSSRGIPPSYMPLTSCGDLYHVYQKETNSAEKTTLQSTYSYHKEREVNRSPEGVSYEQDTANSAHHNLRSADRIEKGVYNSDRSLILDDVQSNGKCNEVIGEPESEVYCCGACLKHFVVICELHKHLQAHRQGGSYFYDHQTRTAYPRFGHVGSSTQTEETAENGGLKLKLRVRDLMIADSGDLTETKTRRNVKKRKHKSGIRKKKDTSIKLKAHDRRYDQASDVNEDELANQERSKKSQIQRKRVKRVKQKSPIHDDEIDLSIVVESEDTECVDDQKIDTNNLLEEEENEKDAAEALTEKPENQDTSAPALLSTDGDDFFEELDDDDDNEDDDDDNYECDDDDIDDDDDYVVATRKPVKKKRGRKPKPKTDSDIERERKREFFKSQKKFLCDVCDKRYMTDTALQLHKVKYHLESGSYIVEQSKECRYCGEMFEQKRAHSAHVKECDKNDSRKCIICDTKFSSFIELREHFKRHTDPEELHCKICGKKCSNPHVMRSHVRRHTRVKNIQCDKCGKAFFYHNLLIKHLVYCTGMRTIDCPKCDLKFKSKEALKHHSIVHMDEKRYVCHICGYAGKKLMYLKRHIRTHTGEKPYTCKECGMRFAALNGLNRHNKIHTNTKNYVCSYCGKSFTNNWNLKTHLRQHTGDTPYKCKHCGQGFKQNVLVKLHMKSHHPFV